MKRTCPSGAECPSQRCRYYVSGCKCVLDVECEHTLVEIAITFRISEAQVRLDEARALAKLRQILDLDFDNSSSGSPPFLPPVLRFAPDVPSGEERAPHVIKSIIGAGSGVRRAGPIPRRWSKP